MDNIVQLDQAQKRITELTSQKNLAMDLLISIATSQFWPEEDQCWGYLISESDHDKLQRIVTLLNGT